MGDSVAGVVVAELEPPDVVGVVAVVPPTCSLLELDDPDVVVVVVAWASEAEAAT